LNDVWTFCITSKTWSEVKIKNATSFEGRMCHSASLCGDRIFVYGGMKNADTTFESLSVLCLDGKSEDLEEGKHHLLSYFNILFQLVIAIIILHLTLGKK
jgi:hypothetical protein